MGGDNLLLVLVYLNHLIYIEIQHKCFCRSFWGDTIFRGEVIFGEKPFWGEASFWRHIPVKYVMRHFLKHVGLRINKRLIQERSQILVQTYPCKECRETFSKACRFRDQQKTLSGEKPYTCTVCHRQIHILVQYVTDISL